MVDIELGKLFVTIKKYISKMLGFIKILKLYKNWKINLVGGRLRLADEAKINKLGEQKMLFDKY